MTAHFTEADFEKEVLKSDVPVLVDFYAEWCGPCKMMGPSIDKLAKEYEGKIKIGKLDVDANPGISEKYGIQSIPTLYIFKNGEISGDPIIGFQSEEKLRMKLQNFMPGDMKTAA